MRCFLWYLLMVPLLMVSCKEAGDSTPPPPPKVQVVILENQPITIEKDFVGQVYGYRDVPVRTRTEGVLLKTHFREGTFVKKDALLYSIDPEPQLEQLNRAQSERASALVRLEKANNDLKRIAPLAEINAVSQKDLDAARAEKEAAEAMLEASKAGVRLSEIKVEYASVRAPVDGIIGKTMAREGEFVGRSPNPVILNTVSSIDSVRVEFFLTERDYLFYTKERNEGRASQKDMPLKLLLADGNIFPEKGRIDFVNREVDAATGAILISAIFPNPERLIRPGQFARVRIAVRQIPDALLVPQRCVSEVQGLFSVIRVNADGIAERVPVEIGPGYRDFFVVESGLEAGDRVVFEGLQRAGKGGAVEAEEVKFKSQNPAE